MPSVIRSLAGGVGVAWRAVTAAAVAWLGLTAGYLLTLLALGRRPLPPGPPAAPAPGAAVVVLVPAHDEAAGIGATLASLGAQDDGPLAPEVIVIADNCTDATAELAETAGVTTWRRHAPQAPGKPAALGWALDRLRRERPETAVVVIVDADCQVSPNLCAALVAPILAGRADAAQARYDVSNADQAPTAALRAAGFTLKHVIRARGRARLGLSCGLFGTGMAFSSHLLRSITWADSVTEDTELFLRIVRAGHRIAYVEEAVVSSPMPTSRQGAREQQLRWETGNVQLARRQLVELLVAGVRTGRADLLGAAVELALPSQSLLGAGSALLAVAGAVQGRRGLRDGAAATLLAQSTYVAGGLLWGGGPELTGRLLADGPAFVTAKLGILTRVVTGRGAATWVRTQRGEDASAPAHS